VWVDNYAPGKFAASVDESLDKLKVDQVDLLLIHWPGDKVPVAQQIEMLNAVKDAGKAKHIGVSNQSIALMQDRPV
jgi:diketogulonate reductase-like aldo/keto reductase